MYCPNCGQQQLSDNTKFCSRCGISTSGLAEWLAGGGGLAVRDEESAAIVPASPKRKGIRRGAKLMFLSAALIPVFFVLSIIVEAPIPLFIPITVFLIGLSMMLYARLFGEEMSHSRSHQTQPPSLGAKFGSSTLPPASNNMANRVGEQQVRTSELIAPPSVTEHTTKLLEKDQL